MTAADPTGGRPRPRSAVRVVTYVAIVGCLGAAAIVESVFALGARELGSQWLVLAALTAASSAVVLRMSSVAASFSVAEVFTFTAVLLFGPAAGTLTVAVDCLVISLRLAMRGLPPRRLVLNMTAPPLAMWAAAHLLFLLADVESLRDHSLGFVELVLPLSASAVVYYLLDTWMIALAVAFEEGRRAAHVWREHFVQLWVSFLVGAHAAGVLVLALGDLGLSFLAIATPLPLLVFYAMRTWLARLNDQVRHLEEVNEQSRKLQQQQMLRLQTEVALRERDQEFRAVFDNALDGLVLVDDERRPIDANPAACALLGVNRDALPVAPIDSLLDQASAADVAGRWPSMLAGDAHHGELVLPPNGTSRTVEFSFTPGVVPGRHLFSWRDVSERNRLEEQLRQAQKMEIVGRLAGGVAHDFNNLLTAILGYSDLVLEQVDGPVRAEVEEISRAAERAASLTRQLLAFSRKQVLQSRVMNLNEIVSGVEKMLRRLLDETIELETRVDASLWPVKIDPVQIEQVILNLAVNARDAMPDGGRLVIETANVPLGPRGLDRESLTDCTGPCVVMKVRDTGTGMDAATRERIFEPFFTTKEQGRGTGLGLSMVYGIVRQSGGQIRVETALGSGTTFSVYFPRMDAADPERTGEAVAAQPAGGSETVLLVEDEPAVRALARSVLQRKGYRVLEATGGQEACRIVDGHDGVIHVLVTDIAMPGMNGRELAAILRHRLPHLPIMFMSGYGGDAIASHDGMDDSVFCQKPFTPAVLTRTLRDLIDTAARRKPLPGRSAAVPRRTQRPGTDVGVIEV